MENIIKIVPKNEIVSTLDCENVDVNLRRNGNSTRQINFAVEKIMQGYEVVVQDHFQSGQDKRSNRYLFERVLQRLIAENNLRYLLKNKYIEVNDKHHTIKLIKEY